MRKTLAEKVTPAVQKVSSTRAFARFAPYVLPATDRLVHRLSRGRVLLSDRMLPGLILTSTGARTGLPRRTPLACVPEEGGSFLLVGSNFGRPDHPAWSANLRSHPEALISWKGAEVAVRTRLLAGGEREAAWRAAVRFWPPYASYAARCGREIRVFRLVPEGPRQGLSN